MPISGNIDHRELRYIPFPFWRCTTSLALTLYQIFDCKHYITWTNMALSAFPDISKSVVLDDGTRYAYAHVEPATTSQPTFLLVHGFPSSSYDWRHQIEALKSKGFGILAPDLLGYGDTDSPSEVENYSLKRMSGHIAEILVKQGIKKVIGVGHDW